MIERLWRDRQEGRRSKDPARTYDPNEFSRYIEKHERDEFIYILPAILRTGWEAGEFFLSLF